MAPAAKAMKWTLSVGAMPTAASPTIAPAGSASADRTAAPKSKRRRRIITAGTAIANSSGMLCSAMATATRTPSAGEAT